MQRSAALAVVIHLVAALGTADAAAVSSSGALSDDARQSGRGVSYRADVANECDFTRNGGGGVRSPDSDDALAISYPYVGGSVRTSPPPTPVDAAAASLPTESAAYPKDVSVFLVVGGRKYRLRLKMNDEIVKGNLTLQEDRLIISKTVDQCYYQGTCTSDSSPKSLCKIAVSTCFGLRGVIHLNKSTYAVGPADNNYSNNSMHCRPHVIQLINPAAAVSPMECQQAAAGTDTLLPFDILGEAVLPADSSVGSATQVKPEKSRILRLAVVTDKTFFRRRDGVPSAFSHVALLTNVADMYLRKLNLRLSVSCHLVWKTKEELVARRSRESLLHFIAHISKLRACGPYDIAVYLSGQSADDGAVGASVHDSVCTDRGAIAINYNVSAFHLPTVARALAHHIGHVLGLPHDAPGCQCSDHLGCLMNSNIQESTPNLSQCSRVRMDMLWQYGSASCVTERKQQAFQSYCGNGVVDRGEECDCGPVAKCHLTDPCCDGATCMLKGGATCRSGMCCDGCQLLNSTHLCRRARNECDVPEYCDGLRAECPLDDIVQNGEPCSEAAHCYNGQCIRRDVQCELLWGPGSRMASDICHVLNNPQGTEYGHCGVVVPNDGVSSLAYVRCSGRDSLCGLLQCTGGSSEPRVPVVSYRIGTVGTKGVDQHQCKSVDVSKPPLSPGQGLSTRSYYMVNDGVRCGDGSLCVAQTCVNLSLLPNFRPCPRDAYDRSCSGRGKCTAAGTCFCNPGYGSLDCSVKLNASSDHGRPASSVPEENKGNSLVEVGDMLQAVELKWLIIIAVSLALLVVGLVVTSIFFVRQRRYCVAKSQMSPRNTVHRQCSRSECRSSHGRTSKEAVKHDTVKRRRRRRFRRQLWSDSDSDSTSDEESRNLAPPIIVHNDPAAGDQRLRQPERGILKKKTLSLIGEERDEAPRGEHADDAGSVSSCSCPADGHCSCGDDEGNGSDGCEGGDVPCRELAECDSLPIPAAVTTGGSPEPLQLNADPLASFSSYQHAPPQQSLPSTAGSVVGLPPAASVSQRACRLAMSLRDDSGHSTEASPVAAEGRILQPPAVAVTAVASVSSSRGIESHCSNCRGQDCCSVQKQHGQLGFYDVPSSQFDSATDSAIELCDGLPVTSSISTLNDACSVSTAFTAMPGRCAAERSAGNACGISRDSKLSVSGYGAENRKGSDGSTSAASVCKDKSSCLHGHADCVRVWNAPARQTTPETQAKTKRTSSSCPSEAAHGQSGIATSSRGGYCSDGSGLTSSGSECSLCVAPSAGGATLPLSPQSCHMPAQL